MTRRTRRSAAGALLAAGVLLAAACSDYEGYLESEGLDSTSATGVERSAGQAEDADWNAVDPAKGGNGYPSWTLGDNYCIAKFNGDQGWMNTYHNVCFFLSNDTKRFTRTRGQWAKFPLTTTKFWTGTENTALGGENKSGYWGRLQGASTSCGSECNGRLSPNPFNNTAVMQFGSHSAVAGIKSRLFLNSGASPMRLSDTGPQPEYDMPAWSSTNYSSCDQGAWITCSQDPNMPKSGATVIAGYRLGTLPLEIDLVNALGPKTTLRRQGGAQVSGLLLDPVAESNAAVVPPEQSGYVGGYRAADGRTASFTARYVVADTAGNTTPAACKATDARPLGCGTTLDLSVSIDKDGKSSSTCQPSPADTRTIKCEVNVFGSPTGPMTATVRVADF